MRAPARNRSISVHSPTIPPRCSVMTLEAIRYRSGSLQILNQLLLPHQTVYDEIRSVQDAYEAIKSMKVRSSFLFSPPPPPLSLSLSAFSPITQPMYMPAAMCVYPRRACLLSQVFCAPLLQRVCCHMLAAVLPLSASIFVLDAPAAPASYPQIPYYLHPHHHHLQKNPSFMC